MRRKEKGYTMKQITNEGITRYTHGDFILTIVEKEDEFEAWIQKKEIGIIMMMFGTPKAQKTLNGDPYEIGYAAFLKIARANFPMYANMYADRYDY